MNIGRVENYDICITEEKNLYFLMIFCQKFGDLGSILGPQNWTQIRKNRIWWMFKKRSAPVIDFLAIFTNFLHDLGSILAHLYKKTTKRKRYFG